MAHGVGGFPEAHVQPATIISSPWPRPCPTTARSCQLAHLLPSSTRTLATPPVQNLTAFTTRHAPPMLRDCPPPTG